MSDDHQSSPAPAESPPTVRGHVAAPADDPRDLKGSALAALQACAQCDALVELARATWVDRAASGREASIEDVRAKAESLGIAKSSSVTPLGDAVLVLGRGPEDAAERALGAALIGLALAEAWKADDANDDKLAGCAIALSARTQFDVLSFFDRVMGERDTRAWRAVAARVKRYDRSPAAGSNLGEVAVACAALAASRAPTAAQARATLSPSDALLAQILGSAGPPASSAVREVSGELVPAPRGAVATTLLALTGLLLAMHVARFVARAALAYRTPAEVTLSSDGVRIRARTMLLGRTLRVRETAVSKAQLAQVIREVRYPRLGLYVGLFALAVGSYVGVGTLSDGVRSASPSLLLIGLLIIAAGIAFDLAMTSLLPGASGRCRMLFIATKGPTVCLGGVDAERADSALAVLKA